MTAPSIATTPGSLYLADGSTASDGWSLVVTPESAGWGFAGLRVADLAAGGRIELWTGEDEAIVLPLTGACVVVWDGAAIELEGRIGVLSGPSDFAYVPREADIAIESSGGGRFAVATARATRKLPFRYSPASSVPLELRGAGASSREVRNFAAPAAFETERLIAVEVITPGGNWSSYPPHKHDEDGPEEAVLEEIYYFEIAPGPGGSGIGYQRVYGTAERPLDVLVEVRDRDVVLIPHGWHGPSMAVPGYDMYYLNVMAGPGDERSWLITDDPAHAWVRDTWAGQEVDPRLTATGHDRRPS
jgi:5-deoxy-glucuronate isomerase